MSKDSSAKYYQNNKGNFKKELVKNKYYKKIIKNIAE